MRYGPETCVKCCPYKPAVPIQYSCFWPKIFDEFEQLLKRQYCTQTKNEKIHEIALPKFFTPKYIKPCPCIKKSIEIEYLDERQPTRTEQLGYPSTRQFMSLLKTTYFKDFPQIRKDAILRNYRKSFHSLYTHLACDKINCMKPVKREKPSKKQLNAFMARLEELAAPKEVPEPPEPDRGEQGEMSEERLKKLATPKQYGPGPEKEPWQLKEAQRRYRASPKIIDMARPKEVPPDLNNPDYEKVKPSALKYKASDKIKELATPIIKPKEDSNVREDPFTINPKALKAHASKRIKEMAEPKEYEDVHNRENPFDISQKALKATCSPRLAELAKPKTYA